MPVLINNHKPKRKREHVNCDNCRQVNICIRFEDYRGICRPCWNKSHANETLWCMYCGICGNLSLETDVKTCSDCGMIVGICCGKLYHCQSDECECKNCFDYKCTHCDSPLDGDRVYVSDGDTQLLPLCCNDGCMEKKVAGNLTDSDEA